MLHEIDPALQFRVADMSLAEWGREEMRLSEKEMPGLMALRQRHGQEKPLAGLRIMESPHMAFQDALPTKPSGT